MKKLILIIAIMFSFINVGATCTNSEIAKLKSVVSNINISYDAYVSNNEAHFDVTLSNLTDEIYVVDNTIQNTYYSNSYVNKELIIKGYTTEQVKYKFYSNKAECKGTYLGIQFVTFPKYNYYYEDDLCKDIEGLDACNKWVDTIYPYNTMVKIVENYKKEEVEETKISYKKTLLDKILDFYLEYYIYIFGFIILLGVPTVVIVKKKTKVDLDI